MIVASMRTGFSILAMLVAISPAFAQTPGQTPDSEALIRAQIAGNWNIDFDAAKACPTPFDLSLTVTPDGDVTGVEVDKSPGDGKACNAIVRSARRAVFLSSPLKIDPSWAPVLRLHFDLKEILGL